MTNGIVKETIRINTKGQAIVPVEIREKAGLLPHTDVEFAFDGHHVRIVRKPGRTKESRGARDGASARAAIAIAPVFPSLLSSRPNETGGGRSMPGIGSPPSPFLEDRRAPRRVRSRSAVRLARRSRPSPQP
ncbi:MAG TPA: AbrB/MazE/SpoVT family DNA-binding domain-containing protein [Rhizomicrobium sp.]